MLDDNPVLRERVMAFGAFAGIGIFAIAAVDVMISGGFDFGSSRAPYGRQQPSAYVRVVDAAQHVSDRFRRISWDEPMFVAEAAAPNEDLAGASDGSPNAHEPTTERDLYQAIASLYEREPAPPYVEAPTYQDAGAYDEQAYEGEDAQSVAGEKEASAYENASPW